ncbi:hypothetical protein [Nocardioides sp. W7]|nr:hypothetical protein [Nocardioides sp. W7]
MIFFYLLLALAATLAFLTIRTMVHDSRGTRRPPTSHYEDPAFREPGYLA